MLFRYTTQAYRPSTNVTHVFETLAVFLSKGQLFVETVPPLPLLAAAHLSPTACHWLGILSQATFAVLLNWKLLAHDLRSYWWLSALCALIYCLTGTSSEQDSLLVDSKKLATSILFAVILHIPVIASGIGGIIEIAAGALETCVVAAGMLGTNALDCVGTYLLLAVARIFWVCHRDGKGVIPYIALIIVRTVLLPPLLVCLVYGAMFPFSEVSAGGNYNLSHLEATSRRLLSPVVTNTNSCQSSGKPTTHRPMSLYIRRAGFLWTDSLVWRDESGIFDKIRVADNHNTRLKAAYTSPTVKIEQRDESYRVFFADPIARRHPWTLETASVPTTELDFLLQREPIHIRSQTTGRYLSVVRGNPSIVDRELGVYIPDSEPFVRFEVGTYPAPFFNSTWILEYDEKQRDGGLRFYHPVFKCYLATSFRTYVDYDGDAGNDTVSQVMNRISEAVCTRGVSRSASVLGVIEGNTQQCSQRNSTSLLGRGWTIARATVGLYRWRRQYGNVLELQDPFAMDHEPGTGSSIAAVVVGSFLLLHSARTLCRRRQWLCGRKQAKQPDTSMTLSTISTVLIWVHVGIWSFSGFSRWHSSTLAVSLSLLGVREISLELLIRRFMKDEGCLN
ncbi:hypothetical protein GGS26DRAFT_591966 [Hypomontagnella submonticulosa]|nr:hypothetical protein GGS26DRAFT_591966 [Hypomontagnella submonticulosa]